MSGCPAHCCAHYQECLFPERWEGPACAQGRVLCVQLERQRGTRKGKSFPDVVRPLLACPLCPDPKPSGKRRDRAPSPGREGVHSARPRPASCAPASPGNGRQRALLDSAQSGALGPKSGEVRTADPRTRHAWGGRQESMGWQPGRPSGLPASCKSLSVVWPGLGGARPSASPASDLKPRGKGKAGRHCSSDGRAVRGR